MKFIPSEIDLDLVSSPGEVKLIRAWTADRETEGWICIHSLEIADHVTQSQGEADFVLIIPNLGIAVVEVKAVSSYTYSNGIHTLGSKSERRGPFKQADDAARSLRHFLMDRFSLSDTPILPFVWFTELPSSSIPRSIEWLDELLLGSEHVGESLDKQLVKRFKLALERKGFARSPRRLDRTKSEKIASSLRPEFTARLSPDERSNELSRRLEVATQEQSKIFEYLAPTPHLIVEGLAGTGKTSLAISAAISEAQDGRQVLLVCFNRLLSEFLESQTKGIPNIKAANIHRLMLHLAGVSNPAETEGWWEEELPVLAMRKMINQDPFEFDTLIVDEGQDVATEEYLVFLDALLKNGLSNSRVRVFGDFDMQGIYLDGQQAKSNWTDLLPDAPSLKKLSQNCRNTKAVGDFVEGFVDLAPGYSGYLRPEAGTTPVSSRYVPGAEGASEAITAVVKRMKDIYPPENIVILSPNKKKLELAVSKSKLKLSPLRDGSYGLVSYGSVHEFKGMEAAVIVLVLFEDLSESDSELFYVAGTRAIDLFEVLAPRGE